MSMSVQQVIDELRVSLPDACHFPPGADRAAIEQFAAQNQGATHDLLALAACSDGARLFGLELIPLDQMWEYDTGLLQIMNWGNGDIECLVLTDGHHGRAGSVVFTNHSPDVWVTVAESIAQWLGAIADEGARRGGVWHPGDYRGRPEERGVYAGVLPALVGMDCELNG